MAQKKLLLLAVFVALAAALPLGGAVYARGGAEDDTAVHATEVENETETENETEDTTGKMPEAQKRNVEARRAEIKQRVEAVKAERAEKLADRRLEACEKRQVNINRIFDKATEQNKKQLAVIQKIEERVEAFYGDKNLTAEGYDDAVAAANAAETEAVAAIEVSEALTFDCTTTDGASPGKAIKSAMRVRHNALKSYRTAVKDLILVVKKHNGQNRADRGDSASAGTEATTEIESSTGGEQ